MPRNRLRVFQSRKGQVGEGHGTSVNGPYTVLDHVTLFNLNKSKDFSFNAISI